MAFPVGAALSLVGGLFGAGGSSGGWRLPPQISREFYKLLRESSQFDAAEYLRTTVLPTIRRQTVEDTERAVSNVDASYFAGGGRGDIVDTGLQSARRGAIADVNRATALNVAAMLANAPLVTQQVRSEPLRLFGSLSRFEEGSQAVPQALLQFGAKGLSNEPWFKKFFGI